MKKTISVILCAALLSGMLCFAASASEKSFTITNPYDSVTDLLGNEENHYKTSMHSHSTVSDADEDFYDMIMGFYDEDYDIVGFAEHGVIGKYWNEKPTQVPLYLYQYLAGNKVTYLTDDEFAAVVNGSFASETRTKTRGMNCLPTGIELNMLTISKSHVCGYFSDFGENDIGFENGQEYAVKGVEKAGGLSFINHPGDWLGYDHNVGSEGWYKNIRRFADIYLKYPTCLGMEVFNDRDIAPQDRIFWDDLLQYVIPAGNRNVWAFSNNDAHNVGVIDSSFMDFVLPSYSIENTKAAMQNGTFFAVGRYAKTEMGSSFRGTGAYPTVTGITVDDSTDTITVTAKDTDKVQWISNGKIISENTVSNGDGTVTSVIRLSEYAGDITCYVRFQLIGNGGVTIAQPFICDDGNMADYIIADTRTESKKLADSFAYNILSLRIFVIFQWIIDRLFR